MFILPFPPSYNIDIVMYTFAISLALIPEKYQYVLGTSYIFSIVIMTALVFCFVMKKPIVSVVIACVYVLIVITSHKFSSERVVMAKRQASTTQMATEVPGSEIEGVNNQELIINQDDSNNTVDSFDHDEHDEEKSSKNNKTIETFLDVDSYSSTEMLPYASASFSMLS